MFNYKYMPIGIDPVEYNKAFDVSIVSVSMNRHTSIIASLHNWMFLQVKEIVIIDWCSHTRLVDIIPTYLTILDEFKKVHIYRVDGFDKWVLTWAFNLGMYLATSTYILKVDAEIRIGDRFFYTNPIIENTFYRGYWDKSANKYLNGQFYCKKTHLAKIGFFNEKIVSYGYDDCDLYKRLNELGLQDKIIEELTHIDHSDNMRTGNNAVNIIQCEILYNSFICQAYPAEPFNLSRYNKNCQGDFILVNSVTQIYTILYEKAKSTVDAITTPIFNEEKFIVLKVFNGIGNRLRALLSTLEFSKKYGYKLYVIWENTKGYDNSNFEEHFQLLEGVTFVTSQQHKDASIKFDIMIIGLKLEDSNKHSEPPFFLEKQHKKIFIESSNYIVNMFSIGSPLTCDTFPLLRPSDNVEYIVDYIHANIIIGKYNVFHIRRGDAINGIYKNNYAVSSIYLFAKYINKSDKINVVLSDDYDYCRLFLDVLCPNKYIIINEKSLNKLKMPDENKYGVNMDVVDFFLFRNACTIYATKWSSFSYVAAHVFKNLSKLIVLEDTNRFGLFKYDKSCNIGDFTQSLAVEKYLPYVSQYIDRDYVGSYSGDKCIVVMAGWFMHSTACPISGCICDKEKGNIDWPPSRDIKPLFISFNVSNNLIISSDQHIEYIRKHGPVGCRDIVTQEKLRDKKIDTYFSLCLTLTLKYENIQIVPKQVLCIDVPENRVNEEIRTKYNCIFISNVFNKEEMKFSTNEKMALCDNSLRRIVSSELVITSRLHVLTICLANNVPVRFIENDRPTKDLSWATKDRYSGIIDLIGKPDLVKKTQKELEISIISKIYESFYKDKVGD